MTEQKIRVPDLDDDTNALVTALAAQLNDKSRRNLLRQSYYDAKSMVRQVASILPPQYRSLSLVVGWSAKAVDLLARRTNLDGFTWASGDIASLGAGEVWRDNALGAQFDQGAVSSLIHASSFVTTSKGLEGEPDVSVQFHSALDATGFWNARTHRMSSALVVNDRTSNGQRITGFTLHEPGLMTTARFEGGQWQVVERDEHAYGMTADLLPYRARLGRPFGSSRISRPVMALQDAAVRELLRLEGHMDIYSYPELILLGADTSIFRNADGTAMTPWQVMMGRVKGIPDDDDAAVPRADVKQLSAASPEPHLASLNAYAKMFAREASLPDSSVAITDFANPTSADAYDASQYDLIAEAEGATDEWTPGIGRAYTRALAMKNSDPSIIASAADVMPKWRNPRFLSRAAEADAGMKQLTAVPWLADTTIGLDLLGLSEQQSATALGEKDRAQAASLALEVVNAASTRGVEDGQLKDKAEALGTLIRSGVDPDSAAAAVGLSGLKFTGAVPVTLRPTQAEASALEDQ